MASVQELARLVNEMECVDLSPLFHTNMPQWHTHPDVAIIEQARNYAQSGYYLQLLILPEHSGSHVDAPPHIIKGMMDHTIETFPANTLLGIAKKIDLSGEDWEPGTLIPFSKVRQAMKESGITVERDDIVLFDFGWSKYLLDIETQPPHKRNWWGENEPGLDEETCRYLSEANVRAVGSDTAACDIAQVNGVLKYAYGHAVYFLPKNILIIEGLTNLHKVPPLFYFMALPLKIKNGSGSPLRPVALFPRA